MRLKFNLKTLNATLRGTGPRHANRIGDVRVRHGCISGCNLEHTSPGARVERENGSPSNSLWK